MQDKTTHEFNLKQIPSERSFDRSMATAEPSAKSARIASVRFKWLGGVVAFHVLVTWLGVQIFALFWADATRLSHWVLIPVLSFLGTGLFITAHEAMHGLVFPEHPRLNKVVGALALRLFALFDYRKLLAAHKLHHGHPASEHDPDFHDGRGNFFLWFFQFLKRYMTWAQLLGMSLIAISMEHLLKIPKANIYLFWVLPLWTATFQLFFFGTYLPHRVSRAGFKDDHRARSNEYPTWLSLLTCYHFGYHWEHHQYPFVPWWRLPLARSWSPALARQRRDPR